jgi:hypothetical protein
MMSLSHPSWCARNYRCTATRDAGEHLSRPWTLPVNGAGMSTVVSMIQRPADPTPLVEIRLRVRLAAVDEAGQARQIRRLLLGLGAAVKRVTAP